MKKSKLNHSNIKILIAWQVANGFSQRRIAYGLGASQPAISRILRHDDVKKMIRDEKTRLVRQVKAILENIENDPRIIAEFQRKIEKKLLNF